MSFFQFSVAVSPSSLPGEVQLALTALVKVPGGGDQGAVRKHVTELLHAPIPYNVDRRNTLITFTPEEGGPVQPPGGFEENTPAMKIMPDGVKVWILKTPL